MIIFIYNKFDSLKRITYSVLQESKLFPNTTCSQHAQVVLTVHVRNHVIESKRYPNRVCYGNYGGILQDPESSTQRLLVSWVLWNWETVSKINVSGGSQGHEDYRENYSRTLLTRTPITQTTPLTRTESQFPWIWTNFSVIFTRITRTPITRKPR